MAVRSAYFVRKTVKKFNDSKDSSKAKQNDLFAIEVNKMTRLHLLYIIFERALLNLRSKNIECQNLKKTFDSVLANFALK